MCYSSCLEPSWTGQEMDDISLQIPSIFCNHEGVRSKREGTRPRGEARRML